MKIGIFEFMLTVAIARSSLAIRKGFAKFLQQPAINLQFYDYAESVFESLKEHRLERQYTEVYEPITEKQNIDVPATIQAQRREESEATMVFYRRELFYSTIDE